VLLGLGAALLISSIRFGGDFYKAIFFLPVMATLLAMAIVWEFTLDPIVGVLNEALRSGCSVGWLHSFLSGSWLGFSAADSWYGYGCDENFPVWLGDRKYALGTIGFIGIWQAFGFNMVLYLAGLTGVPRELYNAAEMDGASSAWERFKLVTWPMLGPTHVFVVTITSIRSFQVFDTVEALTRGGPSKSTYVMVYAMFEKGIRQNLVGIGSAITIVFLAFVLALTISQVYFVNRRVHYS
jgi:multiple sugar transport system permease protein